MVKRNKKKVGNNPSVAQVANMIRNMSLAPAPKPKRKRRNRGKKAGVSAGNVDGVMSMSRREFVAEVTLGNSKSTTIGSVEINPTQFSFLKGLVKSFEMYRWLKLHFYYKPAVGTNIGGLFSMGVDWDSKTTPTTRQQVGSFSPNQTLACWADGEKTPLVLPLNRLQTRTWYLPHCDVEVDKGSGTLRWAVTGTTSVSQSVYGEIWVDYSVQLAGTNPG